MMVLSTATPRSLSSWVGAALTVLLASGCSIQPNDNTLPGQVAVGDDGYGVSVIFDKVENLVPNSQVLKDNVVVGTVASIEVDNWQARVEMRLLDSVELPTTSVFAIGQKTLLGAQYVEVDVPEKVSAVDPLQEGDVVPVTQTGSYPATEQVLGAVALLLNNGGLSQISTITTELSAALRGRTPDARDLVRRSNELLTVLDENRTQIVNALKSLNRLSAGLAADRAHIARAIDKITPGLQSLEQERKRLVTAVTTTGRTGTRAVEVIQTSQRALLANLDSLQPILSNLGEVSTKLPEALKLAVTIPFPAMTAENAFGGDYANLFTTFDLRGSSLAESFLGLGIPALQAGDPVLGPLNSQQPDAGESEGSNGGARQNPGRNEPGATDSERTGQPDDNANPCLLPALGVC